MNKFLEILTSLTQEQITNLRTGIEAGVITKEEVRKALGLEEAARELDGQLS